MPKKDVVNKHGMVDFYKSMPKKFLLQSHNPNYKDHKLNLPFRMLIIGGSGAGKTQTLMNLIRVMNGTFNNIHIITKWRRWRSPPPVLKSISIVSLSHKKSL